MNFWLLAALIGTLISACNTDAPVEEEPEQEKFTLNYPETVKKSVVDTIFDQVIEDPYRWLEDDRSSETEEWVKAQNEVTFSYLETIPYREDIKNRLSKVWNYEKVSAPFKRGNYTYYYKNDGLQNQYVIYRKDETGKEEMFLNPNNFSEDGTTSLGQISFTEDGSLAAYAISEGGSDWRKVIVIDAVSKAVIEDTLVDVKFSGLSWKGNEGFFYSSYDKPEGSELSAKTDQHKLYFHKLGTPQSEDQVYYGATEVQKRRYVGGEVSKNNRYLFITGAVSTSGNELLIMDLEDPKRTIVPMVEGFDQDANILTTVEDEFYIVTNRNAPNKKLVKATANNPKAKDWKDIISEKEHVLNVSTGAGYIFAQYMVDAISKVEQYDYTGKLIRTVELPGVGTVRGFSAKDEDEVLYYTFTNYVVPSNSYAFNPKEGTSELFWKPSIEMSSEDYVSEQVFYTSKDGTKVPMIITHKKVLS